jgi:hypothetical protein
MGISLLIIHSLLILLPPLAVWRALSRRISGRAAWLQRARALIGPFIAAFVLVILVWLPAYSGQCGGWLGETTPCGFGQYATEAAWWAFMSMVMPALLGMLLGVVVLVLGLIRSNKSRFD